MTHYFTSHALQTLIPTKNQHRHSLCHLVRVEKLLPKDHMLVTERMHGVYHAPKLHCRKGVAHDYLLTQRECLQCSGLGLTSKSGAYATESETESTSRNVDELMHNL